LVRIDVGKSAWHQLSHSDIASDNPILDKRPHSATTPAIHRNDRT
jgi:hypothetical protein